MKKTLLLLFSLGTLAVQGQSISGTKTAVDLTQTHAHAGDTLQYTVVITNASTTTSATSVLYSDSPDANETYVNGTVHASPIAFNDSYTAIGNTKLYVGTTPPGGEPAVVLPSNSGLLANDTIATSPDMIVLVANSSPAHGSVTVNVNGTFTYTPNAGFTGTDTFTYTIVNSVNVSLTSTGTVTIAVNNRVWYVDDSKANGTGVSTSPFNTLAGAITAANTSGDFIYLYKGSANYTGGTLGSGVNLIGAGVSLVVGGTNLVAGATANTPTLGGTLTLANNNTVAGLNISSTTSTGLSGSSVSGITVSNINVTTTTGTAVNLSSVGGAFTFKSISADGAANGMVLINNTGSFTVTGDGSGAQNGSGGTIQSGTVGIELINAQNISLSSMTVQNFSAYAIGGNTVTGLTFSGVNVGGANGTSTSTEGSIYVTNLVGTCLFANSSLSGGSGDTLQIDELSGTLSSLTVTNCTMSQTHAGGNDALDMFAPSGSTASISLIVTNSHFTAATASLVDVSGNSSGSLNATINGNTFTNANTGLDIQDAGSGPLTFDIEGNSFINAGNSTTPLAVAKAVPTPVTSTTATGKIISNTVGVSGVPGSGSKVNGGSNGIELDCDGQGTMTVLVKDNQIHGWDEFGLVLFAEEGSATLNDTVIGNTIDTPNNGSDGNSEAGLWLVVGGAGPPDSNLAQMHIGNLGFTGETSADDNSISVGSSVFDIEIDELAPATQINFPGYTGAATDSGGAQADITSYLAAHNTLHDTSTETIFGGGDDNFHNTSGGADVPQAPLLIASGGIERASVSVPAVSPAQTGLALQSPNQTAATDDNTLTAAKLNLITAAALQRWEATGLTASQMATLRGVKFEVADMDRWYLGSSAPNHVELSRGAGGRGWFIDPAPLDDSEFSHTAAVTRLYTDPQDAPAGRIDLLTTVMHEMGHQLGLPDTYLEADRNNLMYGNLPVGERRLPAWNQAVGATRNALTATHYLLSPVSIGTLPPGKSVTLVFDTTINTPFPSNATQISSSGTVSGGNFSSVNVGPAITQVYVPPVITSPSATNFVVGVSGVLKVTATGSPVPTLSESGALPNGVTFTPGTGNLSGTPASGTGGTYPLVFTAACAAGTNTQNFTLTVDSPPTLGCPATISTNAAGECLPPVTFASTSTGTPTPALSYQLGATSITSPYNFPIGTNVVTSTATNLVGTNTCSFDVIVTAGPEPELSIIHTKTNVIVSWPSAYGCYTLQFAPAILSNSWNAYSGPFMTNGGSIFVTNSAGVSNVFFRLTH